jgi:hypothetical protein
VAVDEAYTEQDVHLVAAMMANLDWRGQNVASGKLAASYSLKARAVLEALIAAGWHKPPDTEDSHG